MCFRCWMSAATASSYDPHWPALLERLSGVLDLEASARATGALVRRRAVGDAATLLRLALAHGPGGLSLRSAAAWAGVSGVAQLSDVALRRRLRGATAWLGQVAGALLSARAAAGDGVQHRRLRIVDGSSVSHPGADGTSWRLHAAYDPATASFTDLELTGPEGSEGFARFTFARSDVAVGDRGYAKTAGLQHVLLSGADFLVRFGWNSLRLTDPDGTRLNLTVVYGRFTPEQAIELPVVVTRPGQSKGSQPRDLFPARLVVLRQHEAVAQRAQRAARRRHNKKRSRQVLLPMTLCSAGFLLVLTSLPVEEVSAERVLGLYRLRWQIELAFKRLKSGLGLHRLAARDPSMARSWLLSHLIMALPIEDAAGEVLDASPVGLASPCPPHRTTSLWRLYSALRLALLGAILKSFAVETIGTAFSIILRHLRVLPRRGDKDANRSKAD